jgi:hypothetical protein
MITDRRLSGHVLHGRSGSYIVAGQDLGGRVWARPCDRIGRATDERLVELRRDDWAQLERILALQVRK